MTAVTLTRTLSGLSPADDAASDALRKIPAGEAVMVEIRRPRSHKNLRRWFALCRLIFDNSEQFKSPDQVHDWLKIMAGHCTHIVSQKTGEVFLVADSIAFGRLDETEFQAIWSRAKDAVIEHVLPTVQDHELEHEIAQIVGLAGGRR